MRLWRASYKATSKRPSKHANKAKQKRASIQPSPHSEQLGVYAHAHGIKLLNRKYFSKVANRYIAYYHYANASVL